MTKRDVMSIALRIMGLIIVYQILVSAPGVFATIAYMRQWSPAQEPFASNPAPYIMSMILNLVLMLLVSYALIFHADRISEKLIGIDSTPSTLPTTAMSEISIFTTAIRIIGVYELAVGIPHLSNIVAQAWQRSTVMADRFSRVFSIQNSTEAIATVILGFCLLLGAKYIADWVCSLDRRRETVSSED